MYSFSSIPESEMLFSHLDTSVDWGFYVIIRIFCGWIGISSSSILTDFASLYLNN